MSDKTVQIYAPAEMLYADGAPLIVLGAVLLREKRSKKMLVRMKLKNISSGTIKSAMVTVRPLNAEGESQWGDVVRLMSELDAARDAEFGEEKSFELLDGDVRSFAVQIGEVTFADGSVWTGGGTDWTELPARKTLEDGLGSGELAAQYRILYGTDCRYMPQARRGLWVCACGGVNRADEPKCHLCRRTYAALKAVNLGSLKAECAQRLALESREQEASTGEAAAKKKKLLRRAVFITPIALLLALLIAVMPGYIAGRRAYSAAAAMLSAGMYDEAASAFAQLGSYGDSREQAEKNVPYQKALYILDCADNASTPGLTLLDMRRSQFDDDEHMRIALYDGAAGIFESLDGYKDSGAKLVYARCSAAGIQEQLDSAAYESACALLADGKYRQARDAFAALGDYRDSASQAMECMYQKGLALLGFAEKYNVRGVTARLAAAADEPDVYHVTAAALVRLGETGMAELRRLGGGDGIELSTGDEPEGEDMQPLCDCIQQLFVTLDAYSDSGELAERAALAGDFTRPFYDYCGSGELAAAISWLNAYDGEFEGREDWLAVLNTYLPFCKSWQLYRGDSTLIPLTVGADGLCGSFDTVVLLSGGEAVLRISFGGDGSTVELSAERGSTGFTLSTDEYTHYYAGLNNQKHFTYLKYNADGVMTSSCEYELVK